MSPSSFPLTTAAFLSTTLLLFTVSSSSAFCPQQPVPLSVNHPHQQRQIRYTAVPLNAISFEKRQSPPKAKVFRPEEESPQDWKNDDQVLAIGQDTFDHWDVDQDGNISINELRAGLESTFQTQVSRQEAIELMYIFDENEDGYLQEKEFEQMRLFRNKLRAATLSKEEGQQKTEDYREMRTSSPSTSLSTSSRLFSVLPYLLPLMDGLVYGRGFALLGHHSGSPLIMALTGMYAVYRMIPKAVLFLSFFGLYILSDDLDMNRLARFNIRQAILLDATLLLHGLILSALSWSSGTTAFANLQLLQFGPNAVFVTLLATIAYSTGSSLLGRLPDKVPVLSRMVLNRTPSIDFDNN